MNTQLAKAKKWSLAPAVLLLFASTNRVEAQGGPIRTRGVSVEELGVYGGTSGNTNAVGTDGPNMLWDSFPNDRDSLHDSPGTPGDGAVDDLDTTDGDGDDVMWGGPEDVYKGDPGDTIHIFFPGESAPGWSGSLADYQRLQALLRWLRDQFYRFALDLEVAGVEEGDVEWPDFWKDKFVEASGKLQHIPVPFEPDGSGTFRFPEVFSIGPYEIGHVPNSPLDCVNWMPFADPLLSPFVTIEVEYTSQQFTKTVAAAQNILQYLKTSLAQ